MTANEFHFVHIVVGYLSLHFVAAAAAAAAGSAKTKLHTRLRVTCRDRSVAHTCEGSLDVSQVRRDRAHVNQSLLPLQRPANCRLMIALSRLARCDKSNVNGNR